MNDVDVSKIIVDAAESIGERCRSYSGRGMYGRSCLGITCSNPMETLMQIVAQIADGNYADDLFQTYDSMVNVKMDSMGIDSIIYFPNLTYEKDDDDEDDD